MRTTQADEALQAHTQAVMVPVFGDFEAMERPGHRFLLARDGLWLEARRRWINLLWPIAQSRKVPIPAGELQAGVKTVLDSRLWEFIETFKGMGRATHPVETGAVVIWNETTGNMSLVPTETVRASVGGLTEKWPSLRQGEHVVMDLHSHGPFDASFSETDRKDTGAEVVFACVVGKLDQDEPEVNLSLFACGIEIRMVPRRKGAVGDASAYMPSNGASWIETE